MPSNDGIIVVGNSCVDDYRFCDKDEVKWGSKIPAMEEVPGGPFYGGAACNITAALSAMGCKDIHPLTAVGSDPAGQEIFDYYETTLGVDTAHIQRGGKSANSIVIVNKTSRDRSIVVLLRAPLRVFEHEAIDQCGANWVVLASLGDLAKEAFDRVAKKRDVSLLAILGNAEITSINKGDLVLSPALKNRPHSILILNREEFNELKHKHAMLSAAFEEIVVTDEAKRIVTNCDSDQNPIPYSVEENTFYSEKWLTVPTTSASVVDTTGAGDLFCAGYLQARRLGLHRADAIQFAAIVSSFGIGEFGAHNGVHAMPEVQSREDVLECISKFYRPLGRDR